MKTKFNIGDTVRPIDEAICGVVTGYRGTKVVVDMEDGFEELYFEYQLIPVKSITIESIETKEVDTCVTYNPIRSDSIDLHFTDYHISKFRLTKNQILPKQINLLVEAIHEAKANKVHQLEIICGKGQGILKTEVIKTLNRFQEIKIISYPNPGSILVSIDYPID